MTLTPQQLTESLERIRHALSTLAHRFRVLAIITAEIEQHANQILQQILETPRVDRDQKEGQKWAKKREKRGKFM